MNFKEAREQVYEITMQAVALDLIYLSAGNISLRVDEDHIAITPGGIKYSRLRPDNIAIVDLTGRWVDCPRNPSSEVPMHTRIFRELPAVNAICHTHSPYAIAFAISADQIPPVNLELVVCGAPIPVAPWACPGTDQPGIEAVKLYKQNPRLKIVLLRNHGLLAIGKTLEQALDHAFDAEVGFKTYHHSLQIGQPQVLTPEQIEEILTSYPALRT